MISTDGKEATRRPGKGGTMNQIVKNCQVEWNKKRGVLHVHNAEGMPVLRISRLPQPTSKKEVACDISIQGDIPGQLEVTIGRGVKFIAPPAKNYCGKL